MCGWYVVVSASLVVLYTCTYYVLLSVVVKHGARGRARKEAQSNVRSKFIQRRNREERHEYFVYKAGGGADSSRPSLERIPPPDDENNLRGVRDFGIIVPRGDHHGEQYLLAGLCCGPNKDAPLDYKLHIYSSERKAWSSTTLPNPCPEVKRIIPEKVITIGEDGVLGWVDFSCGMLVCDLTRQDPPSNAQFIPFPEPLPENRGKLKLKAPSSSESEPSPRLFRDITCVGDGVLKFVEMEHRVVEVAPEKLSDPKDILYDSDLIASLKRKDMDDKPKKPRSRYGWRAVTWSRTISSGCWRKGCTVDVADISIDEPTHSSLMSGLKGLITSDALTFQDLYSAFPTFSMDDDDVLYLKSMVQPSNLTGWVVAVDIGNKTVKAVGGAWSFVNNCSAYEQPFRPCKLSHHLSMTPGNAILALPLLNLHMAVV
ncbi:hypothetical protein QOZ80_3BG0292490 [Eleusine coracana subsp. coracana]|nr:hypothetical protein QOZ80_3BG0292490 [Eleusine coracana subsp. coracana]